MSVLRNSLKEHQDATFQKCRKILPDRLGCGGFVFWGVADGAAAVLGLEGTCTWCGMVWYSGDLLAGRVVTQPLADAVQRRNTPRRSSSWAPERERKGWTKAFPDVA